MRCTIVILLGLVAVPAAANDSAPPPRGPIWAGRQHQPTQIQISEREAANGRVPALAPADRDASADKLYRRVLKQSRRPLPQEIEP
jgi:hypothetical protein